MKTFFQLQERKGKKKNLMKKYKVIFLFLCLMRLIFKKLAEQEMLDSYLWDVRATLGNFICNPWFRVIALY